MRRSTRLLVAAGVFLSSAGTARANDDTWTPSDFENPPLSVQLAPRPPRPPEPRRDLEPRAAPFGARGQVAIFGTTSAGISYFTNEAGARKTDLGIDPTLVYFVAPHLALGLKLELNYDDDTLFTPSDKTNTKSFYFFAGPVLGYDLPLSRALSWFPNVGAELGVVSKQQRVIQPSYGSKASTNSFTNTETDAVARVDLPLLFHASQNFSLGIGPSLLHDFAKTEGYPDIGTQTTTVRMNVYLLGHWGGDLPPEEEHAAPPRRYESHLGTDRTWVLVNDLELLASTKSLPATDTDQYDFGASGSFNRFIGGGVSLGTAARVTVDRASNALGTDGSRYSLTQTTVSFAGILGYAHPISGNYSFYPRASFGFAIADTVFDSGAQHNVRDAGIVYVTAFAPVDYEIAPHFFMGFGPFVSRDLVHLVGPGAQNIGTTVGAGLEIGTWL